LERLELLTRKFHEQFLGGGVLVTASCYPTRICGTPSGLLIWLSHGLLRPSFIPSAFERALRELTRYRTRLIQNRSRTVNRLHKTLEDTNIKLTSVATDIMGKSAQAILKALLDGQTDPHVLAELAVMEDAS
jgi:hypothetical protein